eukprot:764782-Hanusia_phi.AAC.10
MPKGWCWQRLIRDHRRTHHQPFEIISQPYFDSGLLASIHEVVCFTRAKIKHALEAQESSRRSLLPSSCCARGEMMMEMMVEKNEDVVVIIMAEHDDDGYDDDGYEG